jgi:hypothetical protein
MKTLAWCMLLLGVALVSPAVLSLRAQGSSGYHLAKKVVLGGEGGFDLLTADSDARRVYLSRGTHVMIVDADSGAIIGDIPNTNGVHGIALAPGLGKGFTSNGRDGTVTIFNLKSLKVLW